ncbi:MAG TPA: hypothetical protein VFV38_46380, partial [Ktedonobacteraceae bacterium]|nr:hypothetical protein [Ktedonobacteraceae bacterium]
MSSLRFSRKILAPNLPLNALHRESLLQLMKEALISNEQGIAALYHLLLLCAPAGYGKTTLLADTVKYLSLKCCWYFCDRSDMDCAIFLEGLLASIRANFPAFGLRLDVLLAETPKQDEPANYQRVLDAFMAALETDISEQCVLALCNYHEVNQSQTVNSIVNQLLQRLPPQCTLVIESRAMPNLELATLIAKRKMLVIGSNMLRFSEQDLLALAQIQNLELFSEKDAAQLISAFDGWITGILLGSRFGYAQLEHFTNASISWVAPAAYADRQQLFAFLVKEVFRNDQAIYHLLKDTSLLDQIVPDFCNALLGTSDAGDLLEYAKRQGLFVMSINEGKETVYVCHPILRELFCEELRNHNSERYHTLQRQIAILFHQAQKYDMALSHALEAQEYELAATIVTEAVPPLLYQGQNEQVRSLLDRLPRHLLQKNPRLLLLRINAYLRCDDFANVRVLLENSEKLWASSLLECDDLERTLILAEFALARGKLLVHQGEHQLAQKQFQTVLESLSIDECTLRARAYQQLGTCIILSAGPLRDAVKHFQQALQLCHEGTDEILAGELHHQLAIAYEWIGNSAIAEHHRNRITAIQKRLGQPRRIINNLTSMGRLKMYQGFIEEAETSFKTVLTMARDIPPLPSTEAYALLALGELELNRQSFVLALTYLEEALALAHQLEDRYLLNCTLEMLTLAYLRIGDIDASHYYLEQMSLRTDEAQSYEEILYMLVKGALCLGQRKYNEAWASLEKVVLMAEKAGMQRLLLQALIRQAACALEQGQRDQAVSLLQQVEALNEKGDHDYIRQVELHAYPRLHTLMQESAQQHMGSAPAQPQKTASTPASLPEYLGIKILPTTPFAIYALGEPTVLMAQTPVTRWRMARAVELFFFLLESNQPLRKDKIITALWQESGDIEHLNQTFRSTIYYLRQVIGETRIVHRSGLYRLDLGDHYWYDVTTFEEQQRIAKLALEEREDGIATQAFQKMLDLYRGDYLQPFYSDWCIWRRDELRKAFMNTHRQLALIAWRNENWDESLLH